MSKSEVKPKINYPTKPKIKWVKKANSWCKTTFIEVKGGYKQVIEWSVEKPE